MMARVFLSSVTEDRPAMRRLAEALRRAGHEPWIDADWPLQRDGSPVARELDESATGNGWVMTIGRVIEHGDALIVGYSAATERTGLQWLYMDALWIAAAAHRSTFVAHLDRGPLPSRLIGGHAFDLRRDSWSLDLAPLIAALDAPTGLFVGREVELDWLMRHVAAGTPAAVVGQQGSGKHALVAEYARRHAAEYSGGLRRAFHRDGAFGERWLARPFSAPTDPSLLVLDEFEGVDAAHLDRYIERAGAPPAIVIAHAIPLGFRGAVLELSPLSPGEAALLFELRGGPIAALEAEQERSQMIIAAGGIPAALVSAADLYRHGWRLAIDATAIAPLLAAAAPPNSSERVFLEGALPFSDIPIPVAWVIRVSSIDSDPQAIATARRLEAAGLAQLVSFAGVDAIAVHPVAREALQALVSPETRRSLRGRAEEITTRWLTDALAHSPVVDEQRLEHAEALASESDDPASPWRGALQERLAELHRRRGDRDQALRLLERAAHVMALHHSAHGDLHAIVLARRAALLDEFGDRDGARRALADAVAAAQSQANAAPVRWRDVDPAAYEQALAEAVGLAERYDAPGHAARAAFLLADFHGRRGAWEQARPLAEQALRAARRTDEPILVARAYRLLADAAVHGSRYEDARASYEEAIRRMDELGADELAATSRLLYVSLLLQLNRPEPAIGHARWLRTYLDRAPPSWPYRAEAEQTLRLFAESGTETNR